MTTYEGRRVEANVISALADKIVSLGDRLYAFAKMYPGVSWVAKLGEMSLSKNKYVRSLQLIGQATGLVIAPVNLFFLVKNLLSGSEEAAKTIEQLIQKGTQALAETEQQGAAPAGAPAAAPAGVAASVKNPKLRARLIRVALSVQALEEARRIAKQELPQKRLPQLLPGDVIQWKSGLMKILRIDGPNAYVELKGKRFHATLPPDRFFTMAPESAQAPKARHKKPLFRWPRMTAAEARIAGDDLELVGDPEEETEEETEDVVPALLGMGARALAPAALSGLMGGRGGASGGGGAGGGPTDIQASGILEDVGEMVAPRTTQNVSDMLGCGEDPEEEEEEEYSMDDGSSPAGPRNEDKNTRYHVEPAHGQGTVDLLRFTANLDSLVGRIQTAANG
jgi:hypothetical protein